MTGAQVNPNGILLDHIRYKCEHLITAVNMVKEPINGLFIFIMTR